MIRPHAELINRTTSIRPSPPPQPSTSHERNLTEPPQRHKGPSAIQYGLPVPPELTPSSSEPPQRYKGPSATPQRHPIPPEHAHTTTELSLQVSQPEEPSHISARSNSCTQESERVDREAKQTTNPANPEPNPIAPSYSSVQRQPSPPEMSDFRESQGKVGSSSNLTPAFKLDGRETHITPTSVSARNQLKRNNSSIVSHHPRLTADTVSLFVSPIAHPAQPIVNPPLSKLEKDPESPAQRGTQPPGSDEGGTGCCCRIC